MVQAGWNQGPKHARVLVLAKSFTKKLSGDEYIRQDKDLISVAGLFWALVLHNFPSEAINEIVLGLIKVGMPYLGTRNVKPASE